ncbi:NAD synthetase [Chitinispirillum alkaliphilum]|nr:NAD synthetase [Chitinispirillum alkaliphilum]
MKIVLCQLNAVVGDVNGNASMVQRVLEDTASEHPDLLVFPELFIQGYPPRDLLEKRWFIRNSINAVETIVQHSASYPDCGIVLGTAMENQTKQGKGLSNCALLISNGRIVFSQSKSLLPTYDVFDESRYFDPAEKVDIVEFRGEKLGICICEDAWNDPDLFQSKIYSRNPVNELASKGASVLINISASPFCIGKENLRTSVMRNHAVKHNCFYIYLNQIGGNDELIFDGNSFCFDNKGELCARLSSFKEDVQIIDTETKASDTHIPDLDTIASVHDALVLGVGDYVRKCGFKKVLLGLSGGIDSAVVCAICVGALGKENVWGVALPSPYSSQGSIDDAKGLAQKLDIKFSLFSIEKIYNSFLETLEPAFKETAFGLAEENLQARIRGTLLMALSNKFGHMLMATSNKSEAAVGYSTLYGDMNGGLSVISDLPKHLVYELAKYINRDEEIIPVSTLTKPPSAELRPDQKDEDSLPPYDTLDTIISLLIQEDKSVKNVTELGFDSSTVSWVSKAISNNEYKRRQAAPGLKITPKAFGSGRRFPVAARYEW